MEEEIKISKATNSKPKKKKNINRWGIYISICFIVIGLVWYGVNLGVIPLSFLQEQAGPIVLIIIGILILVKSF
ncbi:MULTISPECIES: hypothetical protein [Methanobacterium]|jgi:hypothetical protein|uniref:Uncharacterized protein n=1 Tax=Methanobacterium subterraneum TaxID=59277 RepID=A0A2H4VEK4_9EURY|nr:MULTISPECIES: hypothetical protein [Methanobacterium]MBW4257295.1 hypothetical protein [Methanobacterium sp. YSL]PKL73594.1 MAG: hypothetical protein CVV29_02715 [Methanobacteriales archaeon HGW-Methanobacteriales-2]AUB56522.1 hypothetical protein BK007_11190 [Methanobacterium subterraneum]AUB58610.1 hypothetical protein BK008_10000 [Methanobacterium sp. MZ-A1]MCC7558970.1 hypothetical protein [Methanobacterium sp.]